jgi:hypothetical protein
MSLDLMKGINIRYSEENIIELGRKLSWDGAGTESDPLVISREEGLPLKFAFIESRLYIKLLNCRIEYIALNDCQNISIEKCSFEVLRFVFSRNNIVANSSISKLGINFSFNNCFKECSILKVNNLDSKDNIFKDCTLSEKANKTLGESFFNLSSFVKPLFFGIIAIGILVLLFPLIYIFTTIPILEEWIFMICIFFGIVVLYLIALKIEGKPSHKEPSNKIISSRQI